MRSVVGRYSHAVQWFTYQVYYGLYCIVRIPILWNSIRDGFVYSSSPLEILQLYSEVQSVTYSDTDSLGTMVDKAGQRWELYIYTIFYVSSDPCNLKPCHLKASLYAPISGISLFSMNIITPPPFKAVLN